MDSLEDFLTRLLHDGRVVFRKKPESDTNSDAAQRFLEKAFAGVRLEVAGPLIPFEPKTALEAAELVRLACWLLVDRSERPDALERRLTMSRRPRTASDHLSADLVFRYLPQILRRARVSDPGNGLTRLLAKVLRDWPLSGVLSDLEEEPTSPLEFGNHDGLMLLYAERWSNHPRDAWRSVGRPLEFLQLVGHWNTRTRVDGINAGSALDG